MNQLSTVTKALPEWRYIFAGLEVRNADVTRWRWGCSDQWKQPTRVHNAPFEGREAMDVMEQQLKNSS